jgi:hypothetical protein
MLVTPAAVSGAATGTDALVSGAATGTDALVSAGALGAGSERAAAGVTRRTAARRNGGNAWESNPPRTLTPDRRI